MLLHSEMPYEMYSNNREKLYTEFYFEYLAILGAGIDPRAIHKKDPDFLFRLDQNIATALKRSLPEALINNYDSLQSQILEWSMENNKNPRYNDFYELMFSGFHFDLLSLAGLMIRQEEQASE